MSRVPDSNMVKLFCCGYYEEMLVMDPYSLTVIFTLNSRYTAHSVTLYIQCTLYRVYRVHCTLTVFCTLNKYGMFIDIFSINAFFFQRIDTIIHPVLYCTLLICTKCLE